MLQLLVPAFHGSTALEGVLMSSDRVATICSARTHNCEGSWLLEDGEWPVAAVLDRFSEFWDLSLPVLMVKSAAASESSYESLQYTGTQGRRYDVLPIPLDVSHAAPMPPRMVARGIGRLRPAYLMMWRPWCLSPLSSHAREKGAPSSAGWQRFELALNEYQAETHRVLTSHGEAVLVLNYADLLWDVTAARQRIERWAPCAGALDPSVNERLEVQASGGHWKDAASVTTYAAAHPPAASGYDPRRGACVETLYSDELSADEVRRADEAIAYLSVESRIEVEVPPRPPTPSPPPTPPLPPTTTPLPPPPAPTSHPESHLPELLAAILPFLVAGCVLALLCRTYRRCRRRKYGERLRSKDDEEQAPPPPPLPPPAAAVPVPQPPQAAPVAAGEEWDVEEENAALIADVAKLKAENEAMQAEQAAEARAAAEAKAAAEARVTDDAEAEEPTPEQLAFLLESETYTV